MCIGVPLQVIAADGGFAWCEADQQRERVDMRLVGDQPVGTWVLAFHGAARQVLGNDEASRVRAGRRALAAVLAGDAGVDRFFADLVGREPELPAHLRTPPPGRAGATALPQRTDDAGVAAAPIGEPR